MENSYLSLNHTSVYSPDHKNRLSDTELEGGALFAGKSNEHMLYTFQALRLGLARPQVLHSRRPVIPRFVCTICRRLSALVC